MQEPINTLFSNGTVTSLFLGMMVISIVVLTTWARKLIYDQLASKELRIETLEREMKEVRGFCQNELIALINESNKTTNEINKTLIKVFDMIERLEDSFANFKRQGNG